MKDNGAKNMTLGTQIKKYRILSDKTQIELAEILHTVSPTVNRWENDKAMPSLETIKALAKFYGISLDELCEFNTNTYIPDPLKRCENYLKNLGIHFTSYGDSDGYIIFDINSKRFIIRSEDLPFVCELADRQYNSLVKTVSKGLYQSALLTSLNDLKIDQNYELLISPIVELVKLVREKNVVLTPEFVQNYVKDLPFISQYPPVERYTAWRDLLYGLAFHGAITMDEANNEEWTRPFSDFNEKV